MPFLEFESGCNLLHFCDNLVVAEVADATCVGVVYLARRGVATLLYRYAYLAVSLAEWYALQDEAIDVLNGEEVVVLLILQDTLVYADMLQHKVAHC